jgi:hypothetical protein
MTGMRLWILAINLFGSHVRNGAAQDFRTNAG